jgi:catechol 2,3-dioxygenase-like lactoylglutathione lyase family enzyme
MDNWPSHTYSFGCRSGLPTPFDREQQVNSSPNVLATLGPMLHHLTLWVPDLARAEQSWSWLLGCLGYERDDSVDTVALFRHGDGFSVALEQSSDMVPGMLYSRFRPGLNHLAFRVDTPATFSDIVEGAARFGWSELPRDEYHPIAGGADVVYLEDRDGFEVELVSAI